MRGGVEGADVKTGVGDRGRYGLRSGKAGTGRGTVSGAGMGTFAARYLGRLKCVTRRRTWRTPGELRARIVNAVLSS